MLWTAQLPATGMSWSYVAGEVRELYEEIRKRSLDGVVSELCDVYTCTMCAIETSTGLTMPVVWEKTARGWFARVDFWRRWLSAFGLEFKVEYLRYGGNYLKQDKRRMVLRLAVEDQLGLSLPAA